MKRIITVTGHKNCGKEFVVNDLTKHKNVAYIKPYTDREIPPNVDEFYWEEYHYVLPSVLEDLMRDEKVLAKTVVNGHNYVFFEFQLTAEYNVLYADDYAVIEIKDNYDDVVSVRVCSEKEEQSDRVGEYLFKHEFDCLIDYDSYEPEIVEELIE